MSCGQSNPANQFRWEMFSCDSFKHVLVEKFVGILRSHVIPLHENILNDITKSCQLRKHQQLCTVCVFLSQHCLYFVFVNGHLSHSASINFVIGSLLVEVLACRLFDTNYCHMKRRLPIVRLTIYNKRQWYLNENTVLTFTKIYSRCLIQYVVNFVKASICKFDCVTAYPLVHANRSARLILIKDQQVVYRQSLNKVIITASTINHILRCAYLV